MQKTTLCLVLFLWITLSYATLFAQSNDKLWESIPTIDLQSKKEQSKRVLPLQFKAFQLMDAQALRDQLSTAPLRFSAAAKSNTTIVQLPMPDGQIADFQVYESPLLTGKLAEKFPLIKTYTAVSLTNPNAVAKIDITPQGFHAMILAAGESPVFIEPFIASDQTYYSYYKKDAAPSEEAFICETDTENFPEVENMESAKAGDCQFREYRLALACTGEYANYHDDDDDSNGDITADAMAAMTTSMNRVNGVFETDAGLTMVFVPNNDLLIYTNPNSDPYTNSNTNTMLGQNQTTCNNVIGSTNYDIGHVFGTGSGGVASLNSPCSSNSKARGVTGRPAPIGDPFDIDYVAHEMGHQYGGRHTQNNSCSRDGNSCYEPGSASTIMGYAGICSPNVQNNSDAYFHAKSVLEMGDFITGSGNCANIISTANNQPTVNAGSDYTIPISTPFVLTGIGTDPDSDPITYCWEQYDKQIATMPPVSTSTSGPAFRSFNPTTDPQRYFPRLSVVAGSGTDTWEVLPSVTRTLNFRLVVRDNNTEYGCNVEDDMIVNTDDSAGPFLVTAPNTAVDWVGGDTETVTWNVANTTAAPVSCANVDILYSTDGGLSFPNTILSNVPNDGSQLITVPNNPGTEIRIIVICSDNIFFDMSNQNITILAPLPVELISFTAAANEESISLDWETANEENNRGFEVQRSSISKNEFETIGWMDGIGNTIVQRYGFEDKNVIPGVDYYYRLKQIDFDDDFEYSDIRTAQIDGRGNLFIQLAPNPVRSELNLNLSGEGSFSGSIEVISAVGQLLQRLTFHAQKNYQTKLDVSSLTPGVYFLKVTNENGIAIIERFLKE